MSTKRTTELEMSLRKDVDAAAKKLGVWPSDFEKIALGKAVREVQETGRIVVAPGEREMFTIEDHGDPDYLTLHIRPRTEKDLELYAALEDSAKAEGVSVGEWMTNHLEAAVADRIEMAEAGQEAAASTPGA